MKKRIWKSAILAGIIAGVAMLILEMVMNPLFLGKTMWGPSRMIGAIVAGKGVLPPPGTFHLGAFLSAAAVHFPLSVIYAIIITGIIKNAPKGYAILIGGFLGLVIYLLNFYPFTNLYPWFANARNWVQIVIHILFGAIAAWSFMRLYKKSLET